MFPHDERLLACVKCKLCLTRTNVVLPSLCEDTEIVFLNDFPSSAEDKTGVIHSSENGQMLLDALQQVNIDPLDPRVGFTSVVKCWPQETNADSVKAGKFNRPITVTENKTCFNHVIYELSKLPKLRLVVCVGAQGVKQLLGTSVSVADKMQGKFFDSPQFGKVFVIPHPSRVLYLSFLHKTSFTAFLQKQLQIVKQILERTYKYEEVKKEVVYKAVTNLAQADWLFNKLNTLPYYAFDIESTSLDFLNTSLLSIAFTWVDRSGFTLPLTKEFWGSNYPYIFSKLKESLENSAVRKIAQNAKFDLLQLRACGIEVTNLHADTMLMHYCIDENGEHGLKELVWSYTDMGGYEDKLAQIRADIAKERKIKLKDLSFAEVPSDILWWYNAADTDATLRLYHLFLKMLQEQGLWEFYQEYYVPMVRFLEDVEYRGVSIDTAYLDQTIATYIDKVKEIDRRIQNDSSVKQYVADKKRAYIASRTEKWHTLKTKRGTFEEYVNNGVSEITFKPSSSKQLSELLFKQLQVKSIKTTKKGSPSVTAEVLESYAKKVPVAKLISQKNKLTHLMSTFLVGIKSRVNSKDGKIHTSFNLHVAVTARLCVDADTLLDTNLGCFEISELPLKEGAEYSILTHTGNRKRILNKYYKGREEMIKITLYNGSNITCTKEHRILTQEGWKHARELSIGDPVFTYSSCKVEPISSSQVNSSGGCRILQNFFEGFRHIKGEVYNRERVEGIADTQCGVLEKPGIVCFTNSTDSIRSIELVGIKDVWDIEVEEDHSYCAQGMIHHNSSTNPNLQNIPNKTNNPEDFKLIRNIFSADPECFIVECDYGQAEFRMWGQISGDEVMYQDLAEGVDIHRKFAGIVYHIPENEVTKDQRNLVKAVVFGTIYGRTPESVAEDLEISVKEAKAIQALLFKRYAVAAMWLKTSIQVARRDGYVEGLFGQRRHLKDTINSTNSGVRSEAERQAMNSPLQGSASQMTCFAGMNISKLFKQYLSPKSGVIMLIHDAVVMNVHRDDIMYGGALELIEQGMLFPHPKVTYPMKIDFKIGKKWGDAEEMSKVEAFEFAYTNYGMV